MTQAGEQAQVHSNAHGLGDGRLSAPSAERNQAPIIRALGRVLSGMDQDPGAALEIASGTGQHAVAFARAFPAITWQPTDIAPERLKSINAWREAAGVPANLLPARRLDATRPDWPEECASTDLVVVINLFHLISKNAARQVLNGAARVLKPGGILFIYGPFREADGFRSAGDANFHASIVAVEPDSGYKADDWMRAQAEKAGLEWLGRIEMPANNLSLTWRKTGQKAGPQPGGGVDRQDGEGA